MKRNLGQKVIFVSTVPPLPQYPNGFSGRLRTMLASSATVAPTRLLHLYGPDCDSPVPANDLDSSPIVPTQSMLLPARLVNERSFSGTLVRILHYVADPLPLMCHPRRKKAVLASLHAAQPSVVVLHLPVLAHFAKYLAKRLTVILLLEEGWERLPGPKGGRFPRVQKFLRACELFRASRLYRRAGRAAHSVVVIADEEREWFARNIDGKLIQVLPHVVDCNYYTPALNEKSAWDVGVFGDFRQERNQAGLLRLLHAITREAELTHQLSLLVVGAISPQFRDEVSSFRIATCTGFVSDPRDYFSKVRVIASPTVHGTGVKTTVLQAWASGKPVVASTMAARGIRVRNGENALVVKTPEDMVGPLRALLGSEERLQSLGEAGRATAVAFHSEAVLEELWGRTLRTALLASSQR